MRTKEELERCFVYHPPSLEEREKYEEITAKTKELAELIFGLCPSNADRSAALRQLRNARMTANASIACRDRSGDQP